MINEVLIRSYATLYLISSFIITIGKLNQANEKISYRNIQKIKSKKNWWQKIYHFSKRPVDSNQKIKSQNANINLFIQSKQRNYPSITSIIYNFWTLFLNDPFKEKRHLAFLAKLRHQTSNWRKLPPTTLRYCQITWCPWKKKFFFLSAYLEPTEGTTSNYPKLHSTQGFTNCTLPLLIVKKSDEVRNFLIANNS